MGDEYTAVEAAAIDLLLSFPVTPVDTAAGGSVRTPLGAMGQLTSERREASRAGGLIALDRLVDEFAVPDLPRDTDPLLLITLYPWVDGPEGLPGGGERPGHGFTT